MKAEQLLIKVKTLKPNECFFDNKNDEIEKDLFQDEDEEENDYHILNELNDYKKEQLSGYSKSTFKQKPMDDYVLLTKKSSLSHKYSIQKLHDLIQH